MRPISGMSRKTPEVDVAIAGPVDDVAAGVAVGADCRLGERGDVEPALDQLVARAAVIELRVADEIGAIVGEAVEVAVGARRRSSAACRSAG